ncbi:hypothetical protein A2814_03370 [Candidatus Nomurabacteria bacterium RIFCSPHIGHO2_01_FULL_38_19]|uniref:Uncharacterized protein n=1 Tax=Candidatus Nomurabacteria bacterium RIFCSPHIGHO2_01_FULL_38_19 TaxID=1801732 RepID=A0A1F6UQB9_9BACT|nr:MAG: hypothetical protein A2814_03370 [Candidatus Nomurabacteria bacterium RIFCSPHIGHO2_01_FULL_38_19]
MSKNTITINQLKILCRHVNELSDAGFTENVAVRLLELGANIYAKDLIMGTTTPDYADQFPLWSKAALKAKNAHLKWKYGRYLRVEHGTPRRQFARLVLKAFQRRKLTKPWMDKLCHTKWKVAIITHEEDARLARSKLYKSPEARWEAAKIKF